MLKRFLDGLHPSHKRIAIGAAWVALFAVLGKSAGAAREMGIAWRYGVGATVDAYQLATTILLWLPVAVVSVLSVVLIPMIVRLRREGTTALVQFLREMQGTALLIGAGFTLISVAAASILLPYFTTNLSTAAREQTWLFVLAMAPLPPLTVLAGVYAARMMADGRQANTLLEGIPAVVVLLFVIVWAPGALVAPLLAGTLVGSIVHVALLRHAGAGSPDIIAIPRLAWTSSHWPELRRAAGVTAAGQVLMSAIAPLDQFMAAGLGDGAIATLGYAYRLWALLLGIGAVAIARSALPVMSSLHAEGRLRDLFAIARRWTWIMLAAGCAIAAVAWALAPWAVRILFERGAFSSADTALVSEVLRSGLLQLPFYFAGLVLVQLLACQGRFGTIALLAASNLTVKVVLNVLLADRLGVSGISLATSLMYAWSAGSLYVAAFRVRN